MEIKKLHKGFTLIELLLVMAVLAVVGGITSTFLFGTKTNAALEEDARQIANILKAAQNRATTLEEGTQWGVHFDNLGADPFYELFWGISCETGTTTDRIYLGSSVVFQIPPAASSTNIVFSKRMGNPSNGTSTTIIVRDIIHQATKTITVSPIGRVTVQ